MCGIYGRVGPRDDALDRLATLTLGHRGPDDAGLYVDPHTLPGHGVVALGHVRLAVQDLSQAGHQPMVSDDGGVVLVYNGEIYNFRALRDALRHQGASFRSGTDTEVLLRLYERDGDAFLSQLRGMFALAVWDRRARRLLLARDHGGIKPLFFRCRGADIGVGAATGGLGPLAFASEPKALLRDLSFQREPDLKALRAYLNYLYIPPPRSGFVGIAALLPGHQLVWRAGGGEGHATVSPFAAWSPDSNIPQAVARPSRTPSFAANVDTLDTLLRGVVADHLVADVPVGALLSGGIDSGLLVALTAAHKRARGDSSTLQTFTLACRDAGADETAAAAAVARALGVAHEAIVVPASAIAARVPHIVDQCDVPFANPSALLQDVLFERARTSVTVVLSGDGGDEAFGGYPRHRAAMLWTALRHLPMAARGRLLSAVASRIADGAQGGDFRRRLRRLLTALAGDFPAAYRAWLTFYTTDEWAAVAAHASWRQQLDADPGTVEASLRRRSAAGSDARPAGAPATFLASACWADARGFLPDNLMVQADRMSMRHGLELRVPFADPCVQAFGLALADGHRMSPFAAVVGGRGHDGSKRLLRHLARRYLPRAITVAPKQGLVPPMARWLTHELGRLRDDMLSPTALTARGLVRSDYVAAMMREHDAGVRDRTWNLWALIVLEDWFRRRIDRLCLPAVDDARRCDRVLATPLRAHDYSAANSL